jgi:hypothetical protein
MAEFPGHDADDWRDDDKSMDIEVEITDPEFIARFDAARERHLRALEAAPARRRR